MSSRGHNRERQVKHELESDDWLVFRAAGSLGICDLLAIRAYSPNRLIEVKSTAQGPYERFSPADRANLKAVAARSGAEAWLAWWPPRGKLRWIPSHEWPVAPATPEA